ncbi:MAG: DUF3500 domain-containing protein [Pirellulales bacterium]
MCERETVCADCETIEDLQVPRREFLRLAAGSTAAVAASGAIAGADDAKAAAEKRKPKPAEALIRELYETLSAEQKKTLVLPWNHGADKQGGMFARHGMYNRPFAGQKIGEHYTKAQQELIDRTLHAICADEEGYIKITRNRRFDASKAFENCGSHIFGEPSDDNKFAWLFTSHHLTVRCDGNSQPGAAFGGPLYYGHTAQGYSSGNVYFYQTQRVQTLFDALDAKQRKGAIAPDSPGERAASVSFRPEGEPRPGIAYADLSKDQRSLAESVMRDILAPFRKEDADEVMQIVKQNGGMEKIHFGYYKDSSSKDDEIRWHFWRLEGPGFVWNFRVLPHVHCYVNIAAV